MLPSAMQATKSQTSRSLILAFAIKRSQKKLKKKKDYAFGISLNIQLKSVPLRFSVTRSDNAWHMSGNAIVASQ
jgi:hypothetical protein